MYPNSALWEYSLPLDAVSPVSQGAGTVSTGWVSMANWRMLEALIVTGVLGASATVDAKIQQAQDNAGTGAKDVKLLTQIVKASGDNKLAIISVRDTDLDTNNGFMFVRLSITVGTAASLIAGILRGVYNKIGPTRDLTSSPTVNLGSANLVQVV